MFFPTRPSRERIQKFIDSERDAPFNYSEVGATRGVLPAGYFVNHGRIRLGQGESVFRKAVAALNAWKMFDLDWLELCWPDAPIEEGTVVGVLARHLGFWSVNPTRVVFLLDEADGQMRQMRRTGFAYGTLRAHGMQGEETFIIEWHRGDDSVWYDLRSFSRPKRLMTALGYPIVRRLQRRFALESPLAMLRAVQE
jgi:uncharacterized protein (UPF0548 family)